MLRRRSRSADHPGNQHYWFLFPSFAHRFLRRFSTKHGTFLWMNPLGTFYPSAVVEKFNCSSFISRMWLCVEIQNNKVLWSARSFLCRSVPVYLEIFSKDGILNEHEKKLSERWKGILVRFTTVEDPDDVIGRVINFEKGPEDFLSPMKT